MKHFALFLLVLLLLVSVVFAAVGPAPSIAEEFKPYIRSTLNVKKPLHENSLTAEFFVSSNATFFAGQEIRMRVSTSLFNLEQFRYARTGPFRGNPLRNPVPLVRIYQKYPGARVQQNVSLFPGFNITGPSPIRVRIVPAYPLRNAAGTEVPCKTQTDVWSEFWGMSGRSFAWGRSIAFSGFVTFTVPPFPWKVCVKDVSLRNYTKSGQNYDTGENSLWTEFDNRPPVQRFREPLYLWYGSSTMHSGDFAAIKIVTNGRFEYKIWNGHTFDPFDFHMTGTSTVRGDQLKIVPAGFPCTYEKSSSTADLASNVQPLLEKTAKQYCGSNYIKAGSGDFVNDNCVAEGAVAEGVARTGSEEQNPWATYSLETLPVGAPVASALHLVAYVKLPPAGNYDLCFSSMRYRQSLLNVSSTPHNPLLQNAIPVWFKLYKSKSPCPTSNSEARQACGSRETTLRVTDGIFGPSPHGLSWSSSDSTILSWGTIKISGSGLSSMPASKWEYSDPREYFEAVGGDQFRLVPESKFSSVPLSSYGDLYKTSDGKRLEVLLDVSEHPQIVESRPRITSVESSNLANNGRFVQYTFGAPDIGSWPSASGCFDTTNDNYGSLGARLNGNPGEKCCYGTDCTTLGCTGSDVEDAGVTASGNLGGNPRKPYMPWNDDQTNQNNVWAYVRFPRGLYRICYRKSGIENWRFLPMTGMNSQFVLYPSNNRVSSNVTFLLNDTSEKSVGEFEVRSPFADLTYLDHNLFDVAVADSNVVGSSLKIVSSKESCYTAAGYAESVRPGSKECSVAHCQSGANCLNCLGPADDAPGARSSVFFYLRIPPVPSSSSTYFRVCFRYGLSNWYQIRRWLPNSKSDRLVPTEASRITYRLSDRREGTWGMFLIRRQTPHTPELNSKPGPIGDVIRIIPNTTRHGRGVLCTSTWGVSASQSDVFVAQMFNPDLSDNDIGNWCHPGSLAPQCAEKYLTPTSGSGSNGFYPYTNVDEHGSMSSIHSPDGTVAFVKLPPSLSNGAPIGYKVCYKQGPRNWVELEPELTSLPRFLSVKRQAAITASVDHHQVLYAGMYGYIELTASESSASINRDTDLFKLVRFPWRCDRQAAGGVSFENKFQCFTGYQSRGAAVLVDGTSDATALQGYQYPVLTKARAYMQFPSENTTSDVSTMYRMCLMQRSTNSEPNRNWHELGTITVQSLGIVYSVRSQPVLGGVLEIGIHAAGVRRLNTTANGDRFKLVTNTKPCAEGDLPSVATSVHAGLDFDGTSEDKILGLTDLGPSDEEYAGFATAKMTLPHTGSTFKICLKLHGNPWIAVEQTYPMLHPFQSVSMQQQYLEAELRASSIGIGTFTLAPEIRGRSPLVATQVDYVPAMPLTSCILRGTHTSSEHLRYTLVSGTASQEDVGKLVLFAPETSRGVWKRRPGVTCSSDGVVEANATVIDPQLAAVKINMPFQPGKYLFCVLRRGSATWIQVLSAAVSDYINPFVLISTELKFIIDGVAQTMTVKDEWHFGVPPVAQGSLSASDQLYMVNASGVCGESDSFNHASRVSALVNLTTENVSDSDSGVFSELTTSVVPWLASSNFGADSLYYKVCYFKSSETRTTSTDALLKPFVHIGWYELENADRTSGGGTQYYALRSPTKIVLDRCPNISALRTGQPFEVMATLRTATDEILPFAVGTYAYEITASPQNAFSMVNTFGQCQAKDSAFYGWNSYNLRQYSNDGRIKFLLSPVSSCPPGGCTFRLTAPGLESSAPCTYQVTSTMISSMRVVSSPLECPLGRSCVVRIAAFHSDGDVAYASSDGVQISATGFSGLSIRSGGGTHVISNSLALVGNFNEGYFETSFDFSVADGSLFSSDTHVMLTFTANSISVSVNLLVRRPNVIGIHIVDVYPTPTSEAAVLDGDASFIRRSLVPSWEPAGRMYMGGGLEATVDGDSEITAASGYYLVAQQFYTIVLRPLCETNGVREYCRRLDLLNPSQLTISMTLQNSADSAISENQILSYSSLCAMDESCSVPFSSSPFSTLKPRVVFRLKNSRGCSSFSPCSMHFKFGNKVFANTTSLTTPVRSIATSLSATCFVNYNVNFDQVNFSALSGGSPTCGASKVESGWHMQVKAVDTNGVIDEFFEGTVLPLLASDSHFLTTVPKLLAGEMAGALVGNAIHGVATFEYVTINRPCSDNEKCELLLLSDWGTNVVHAGNLVALPSTTQLKCTLKTQLAKCSLVDRGASCPEINGAFVYDSTNMDANIASAIYPDTPLCVDVTAVNVAQQPTMYDTLWIHYSLFGLQPLSPLRIVGTTENAATFSRYRPMERGKATFCFSVSGVVNVSATFSVKFSAQRFTSPGHWTNGATGTCQLGKFSVFPRKHIGQLKVTYINGVSSLTSYPTSQPIVVLERKQDIYPMIYALFRVYDHYGQPITADNIHPSEKDAHVVINDCSVASLSDTCVLGDLSNRSPSNGQPAIHMNVDPRAFGALVVEVPWTPYSNVTSQIRYDLKLKKFCIGCLVTFSVKFEDNSFMTTQILNPNGSSQLGNITATVEFNVLLSSDKDSVRLVGFAPGTSPLRSWQKWTTGWVTASQIALFNDSCILDADSNCRPRDAFFLNAECDDSNPTSFLHAGEQNPLKLLVAVAEPSASLTGFREVGCLWDDCEYYGWVGMQVDILNSYTIGLSAGSQRLKCSGEPCIDDGTGQPKQIVPAFGSDARSAILALKAAEYQYHTTKFTVSGVWPSDFYPTNSGGTLNTTTLPSRSGPLRAFASTNQSGLSVQSMETSGYSLIWKGGRAARRMSFLQFSGSASCPVQDTLPCLSGTAQPCPFDGYVNMRSETTVAFDFINTPKVAQRAFPFSVEVKAEDGSRAFGAKGRIKLELSSWEGCNNGGTVTLSNAEGKMSGGRYTTMITFSSACQSCQLEATLVPEQSQWTETSQTAYSEMRGNPSTLSVMTERFTVLRDPPPATHVVFENNQANVASAATIATEIIFNMKTVTNIGNLMIDSPASAIVSIYNTPQSTPYSHLWYGNGGVLRGSRSATSFAKHEVTTAFSGSGTIKFLFTRTCRLGCRVAVAYELKGFPPRSGSFTVKNRDGSVFYVTTATNKYVLVGVRPRIAYRGDDVAFALWHVGSDLDSETVNPISIAGVAEPTLSTSTVVVSPAVVSNVNGDGGVFSAKGWLTRSADPAGTPLNMSRAEIHRISFSRPCKQCSVSFAGMQTSMLRVTTKATHLRVPSPYDGDWIGSYPSNRILHFDVFAVDDDDYVDYNFGGSSEICSLFLPFTCRLDPSSLALELTSKGIGNTSSEVACPFLPSAFPLNNSIVNGEASLDITFPSPVRKASPTFISKLSSGKTIIGVPSGQVHISTGFTPAARSSIVAPESVTAFVPFTIGVALTRKVQTHSEAFIVDEASNTFMLSFSATCPQRVMVANTSSLEFGYANISIVLENPTSDVPCTITASVQPSNSSLCNPCSASVMINVESIVATHWRWARPSPWENAGKLTGPMYAAAGRRLLVEVQLIASFNDLNVDVTSCDDPHTPIVEVCKLSMSSSSCSPAPVFNPDASTKDISFDSTGKAVISVFWPLNGDASYDCELVTSVTRNADILPAIDGKNSNRVAVCYPKKLVILSNFSNAGTVFTGVPMAMVIGSVDAFGVICRGDTGDDATTISIDLVTASQHTSVNSVLALNVNHTTSVSTFPPAENGLIESVERDKIESLLPTLSSTRLLAGSFKLQLLFTNSTFANNVGPLKVRISSGFGDKLFSPAFDVVIKGTRLRVSPLTPIPAFGIAGESWYLPDSTEFVLEAVDSISPRWVELGVLSSAPNVPTHPTDIGSSAKVSWVVRPPGGVFPLTFLLGKKDTQLTRGRTVFRPKWTGTAAIAEIQATSPTLLPTDSFFVKFQQRSKVVLNTSTFETTPAETCVTNCALPNSTFVFVTKESLSFFSIFSANYFLLPVTIVDSAGSIVLGDSESVVEARIIGEAGSVSLVNASRHVIESKAIRVSSGIGALNLTFFGATANNSYLRIEISCPTSRPPSLLTPGDLSDANPCASLNIVTTALIAVIDSKAPQSLFMSPRVLSVTPVIKIRSFIPLLTTFNAVGDFAVDLSTLLNSNGFSYFDPDNADGVVSVLTCEVNRPVFMSSDLGTSVCSAALDSPFLTCSMEDNSSCPVGVLQCQCPQKADGTRKRSAILRRYLLATDFDVQVEVSFKLWKSKFYTGTNTDEIIRDLSALKSASQTVLLLNSSLMWKYELDDTSISVRYAADPLNTIAPPTTTGSGGTQTTSAPIVTGTVTDPPTVGTAGTSICYAVLWTFIVILWMW